MNRFLFLSVSAITLTLSMSLSAQEHGKPGTTASPRPPSTSTPRPPTATPRPPRTTPSPSMRDSSVPDSSGWVKFTSALGRFTVVMPSTPSDQVATKQSEHGPYTTHVLIARDTSSVYLIGWVDYDPSFNFNKQSELVANRDNFVKETKATLLTSSPTTIDGYSAIEFVCETAEKGYKSRVYMVGRRPYIIVIATPKGQDDSVQASKFFNSFKVRLG